MKKDYGKLSVALHEKNVGKISIVSKIDICNIDDISTVYSPGCPSSIMTIFSFSNFL